jgi:CDP-diacylglycerol--glycerol-3-phosphate 3-phosphatidyltransferase
MLTDAKRSLRAITLPVARWLAAAGVSPNLLTVAGLLAAALAALSLSLGNRALGIIWLLISALCDLLDGDVARLLPGRASRFGAFLDSTADRLSDALLFGGLLIGKLHHGGGIAWPWMVVWLLALTGGFLVSYARARAEGLGLDCQVGIADRALRMGIFLLLLLLGWRASGLLLALLALLAWITVGQRIRHVARQEAVPPAAPAAGPHPAEASAERPAPEPGGGPTDVSEEPTP